MHKIEVLEMIEASLVFEGTFEEAEARVKEEDGSEETLAEPFNKVVEILKEVGFN